MERRLQGSAARGSADRGVRRAGLGGVRRASGGGDVHPGPGGPDAVAVAAQDNTFGPTRLQLPAGDEVEIEVTNEGGTAHNFTIESLELSTGPIEESAVATATLTVPEGETTFACSIHGGMNGVIEGT